MSEVTPGKQLGAREAMLGKIRRALQIPAPKPGSHGGHSHGADDHGALPSPLTSPSGAGGLSLPVVNNFRQWLPPVGETWEQQIDLFARNAEGLRADFQLLENEAALPAALHALREANNWQRVAFHPGDLTAPAIAALGLPALETARDYDRDALEACDAGFTECDCLIAQTGSVLITSRSAGGRALSVLPPHHVVLARRAQLVPDLPAAFAVLRETYGDDLPSLMSFVTGPSRTGDIERILVLGAHGPKQLTILCW